MKNAENPAKQAGKLAAARAALAWVEEHAVLGVGTGSTVNLFIRLLAESGRRVAAAVSSSDASTALLRAARIEVVDLNVAGDLSLYVDGADETNRHRQLIKGGGAALTREKVVAAAAARFVCIVDESKVVDVLGAFPLPVEVIPMARSYVARQLVRAGGQPVWRENVTSDNGNQILDVHNLDLTDPARTERELNQIAGVVTVGLFAQRPADVVLIGGPAGVREL
ncbi:MAG: ribose-5-phosphate isomerase RpiA [Steroidobacteraceae bacterium]|nr:ribose-5-phosphate isomerase RpiA [Steroidobacteraceae bacterium]